MTPRGLRIGAAIATAARSIGRRWSRRQSPSPEKQKLFQRIAADLGLSLRMGTRVPSDLLTGGEAEGSEVTSAGLVASGSIEGLHVAIGDLNLADRNVRFQVTISDPAKSAPQDLVLSRSESPYSEAPSDLKTGDPPFDEIFDIRGIPAEVSALLSAKERSHILKIWDTGDLTIKDGSIIWVPGEGFDNTAERLTGSVHKLVALGHMLALRAEEIPAKLIEHALTDPAPSVQLANLEQLALLNGDRERLPAVARKLLTSGSPRIRLHAARILGAPEASRRSVPWLLRFRMTMTFERTPCSSSQPWLLLPSLETC